MTHGGGAALAALLDLPAFHHHPLFNDVLNDILSSRVIQPHLLWTCSPLLGMRNKIYHSPTMVPLVMVTWRHKRGCNWMVGVLRPFAPHSFSDEGNNLNVNFAYLSLENFAMCANVKVATRASETCSWSEENYFSSRSLF